MRRSEDLFRGVRNEATRARIGPMLASVLLAAALLGALFVGGEYAQRWYAYTQARAGADVPAVAATEPLRNILLNTTAEVRNPLRDARLLASGLPVYDLRLRSRDLAELQRTAEQVTAAYISTDIPREYVDAQWLRDGAWEPVAVKLRGLYHSHYLKKRPSLRVKFPKDRLFGRKRQINLLDPYDKGLTIDATTNHVLSRRGLLTWDSRFVVLRTNGEVTGLFQEIEQFGRSLADRNGRPEGYIFGGSGQLFGKEGFAFMHARRAIDTFQACHADDQGRVGEACTWEFVRTHFDVDRLAWAAAMTTLLHSSHAWHPDNLRLFWDPARGAFEPIPWDYSCYAIDPQVSPDGEFAAHGFGRALFDMAPLRRERDLRLWQILREDVPEMVRHAEALFEKLEPALAADDRHLGLGRDRERQREYLGTLRANAAQLERLLRSARVEVVHAPHEDGQVIELRNPGRPEVALDAIVIEHEGVRRELASRDLRVAGAWRGEPGVARQWLPDAPGRVVAVRARNAVTGEALAPDVVTLAAAEAPLAPPAAEPPAARVVRLGPGPVVLDASQEFGEDVELRFEPGLELRLGPDVSLIVRGRFHSVGTADAPIRVLPREPENPHAGIFAHGTRTRPVEVRVEHTIFVGGEGGDTLRVPFTSPFSIHDGRVVMRDSLVRDGRAIDGINFKYADVEIRDNRFLRSADDSVDCDFCIGVLRDNFVEDSGGDGLDFSGSDVTLIDNRMQRCADKGMSIGEDTRARVQGGQVSQSYTGIAVKDLSRAEIRGLELRELQVGVAVYAKKPTFGPGHAELFDARMYDVATPWLLDPGSRLVVDGHDAPPPSVAAGRD